LKKSKQEHKDTKDEKDYNSTMKYSNAISLLYSQRKINFIPKIFKDRV